MKNSKSKTHEQFLEDLWNKNKYYRDGKFEVIGEYIRNCDKILTKNKCGFCDVYTNSLLAGYNLGIKSAIDKSDYFRNMCVEKFGDDNDDLSQIEYTDSKTKIKVVDEFGVYYVAPSDYLKGGRNILRHKAKKSIRKKYVVSRLDDISDETRLKISVYIIYTLSDPISKKIRYVGLTTKSIKDRFYKHYNVRSSCKNHKCNWIKSLKKQGLKPIIEELDTTDSLESLLELEVYWISQFKCWGFNLVNSTNGGQGSFGYKHAPETIDKMKELLKLRPKNPPKYKMSKIEQYDLLAKNLSKKIIQYSIEGRLIKIWDSTTTASKYYNVRTSVICNSLNKRCAVALGFLWKKYTDDYKEQITPIIPTKKIAVCVYDIVTDITHHFSSCTEAYKCTGCKIVKPSTCTGKIFKKRYKLILC